MASAATIKRGEGARKRPTVTRRPKKKPANKLSLWARFKSALPVSQQALDRMATGAMIVIVGGTMIAGATLAGVPRYLGTAFAHAAGSAGFEVKRVEVTGIKHMERLTVYAIALDQHSMAMPLVDLDKVRLLDPVAMRGYIPDGNYGGLYERSDEDVLGLWNVAVEETRAMLDSSWGGTS